MIHEKPDTVTDVLDNVIFCKLSSDLLWKQSKPSTILPLYDVIINATFKQQKYNKNNQIDKIILDSILQQSILFN